MKNIKNLGLSLIFLVAFAGCSEDYLSTEPITSTSDQTLFENTQRAEFSVNGVARLMVQQYLSSQPYCGEGSIKYLSGEFMGENYGRPQLTGWSLTFNANFHENDNALVGAYPWYYYYMLLGNVNTIIAKIDDAEGTKAERDFIKAQALTYRAYCYTMLVQFYCYRWDDSDNGKSLTNMKDGLILRTEANMSEKHLPLVSSGAIYEQIYKDLDSAIELFKESKKNRATIWEPNLNVAQAVYARAAITRKDYAKAADMAQQARKGHPLMDNKQYMSGFSAPNDEWIWASYGGDDQTLFYYGFHSYMSYDANTSFVRNNPGCISKTLYEKIPTSDLRRNLFLDPGLNAYSPINGEFSKVLSDSVKKTRPAMRKTHRVAAYMGFKFSIGGSIGVGYINHFRSAEMVLIEAEAKYFSGDEAGAQKLMNALIKDSGRDSKYNCVATGAELLAEIKMYRGVELWGEGFDWFDKKRWNEPIVRKSFADGGNFPPAMAQDRPVDFGNRWTFVTPRIEKQYNDNFK